MFNMDYLVSAKGKLSGRFFMSTATRRLPFPVGAFLGRETYGFPSNSRNVRVFSLVYTYAFNSQLLNEVRFGYTHLLGDLAPTSPYSFSDVGIWKALKTTAYRQSPSRARSTWGRAARWSSYRIATPLKTPFRSLRGRHTMRFGGGFTKLQNNLTNVLTGGTLQFLSFPRFSSWPERGSKRIRIQQCVCVLR